MNQLGDIGHHGCTTLGLVGTGIKTMQHAISGANPNNALTSFIGRYKCAIPWEGSTKVVCIGRHHDRRVRANHRAHDGVHIALAEAKSVGALVHTTAAQPVQLGFGGCICTS